VDERRHPVLPRYGAASLDGLVPALLARLGLAGRAEADWLPAPVASARQVVLLVLDGLGWEQLARRRPLAPTLAAMEGGPVTTVVPSTTATALTSITTGLAPARHGIVGYRMRVGGGQVLNVLRWRTPAGDARQELPPASLQPARPFLGLPVPVVTRAEFDGSGFSAAHLGGCPLVGWRAASSISVEVGRLLRSGERFVYAYYDGVDKVAHDKGLGEHFDAELRAADRLVADVACALPPAACLVVTSDHGQVEVGDAVVGLDRQVLSVLDAMSGEGRFRWLHARCGPDELAGELSARYGHLAWVVTRDQVVDEGWLGGRPGPGVLGRLGDVALISREPVAFDDPADTGEARLVSRHGSLTAAEMRVPLLACRP
jgi:hypothetical protein